MNIPTPLSPNKKGFAIVMVLALLSLMVIHSMSLSYRLNILNRELKQLETQQLKKFSPTHP